MLKALLIISALLGLAVAAVLFLAAQKPDQFRVARSVVIEAPPDRIFPLITNLRGWTAWSPYEKKDPGMKRTHSGAATGEGAVYTWDGDKNVGQGRMEIVKAVPSSQVDIRLDFLRPFEAHNMAHFTLEPEGGSTKVTWAMEGPTPFTAKIVHVVFDVDKMVGSDFEAGLASLKALAEGRAN